MSLSKPNFELAVPALHPKLCHGKISPFENHPDVEEWLNWTLTDISASEEEKGLAKPIITLISVYYTNCEDINLYEIVFKLFLAASIWNERVRSDFLLTYYHEEKALKPLKQLSQLLSKLENKEFVSLIDWDPTVALMYTHLHHIYATFNETQRKCMITIWRNHVKGMTEEFRLVRKLTTFQSVEEMIKVRVDSSLIIPFIQLIEFSDQLCLPQHIRQDPRVIELDSLVAQHITSLNELLSFEKEYNKSNGDLKAINNCVAFVAVNKECTVDDAIKEWLEKIKELEVKIIQIEKELLNEENCLDVMKKYIVCLNHVLGGNYYIRVESKSYHDLKLYLPQTECK